jgi:hypothetical protein
LLIYVTASPASIQLSSTAPPPHCATSRRLMLPVFPLLFAAYLPGIKTASRHPMLLGPNSGRCAPASNGTLPTLCCSAASRSGHADRIR